MLRLKRTRGGAVDYVAALSPLGFALGFTPDPAGAGRFSEDLCALALTNYAPHPHAGAYAAEPETPPAVQTPALPPHPTPAKPEQKKAARR